VNDEKKATERSIANASAVLYRLLYIHIIHINYISAFSSGEPKEVDSPVTFETSRRTV